MRNVGTVVRGIRTPIIKENDDLARIVVDSVINASISEGFKFRDKDVIAITEAVVGISEGNYATIDQIVRDLEMKFPSGEVGVVFPILSRNRFSMILKAIARAMKSITILLSFPKDEVGNGILDEEILNKSEFNISSVISEVDYSKHFSSYIHPFTGINMVEFYRDLVASENCAVKFVFSNDPTEILSYNKDVLVCDIHTREKTKKAIVDAGCDNIYMLTDIMNSSIDFS